MMVDMIDCFMNFLLRDDQWHRQCVKVDGKFWVFRVGMFGSSCAGDFAENFTAFITDIFSEVFGLVNVRVFVDNFDNVVPPLPNGEPDWATAWHQWETMLTVAKILGIRMHDFVEPSLVWGREDPAGNFIDSHLGWGGETYPTPRAWLSVKRQAKFRRLARGWASQTSFSCTEVRQIVGLTQSLEVVLKCLAGQLSLLYAWQTQVERQVRSHCVRSRKAKVFSNKGISRILCGMITLLDQRSWSVPLIDWVEAADATVCNIYADAAVPKEDGLAYSPVWGKAAYCEFEGQKFYYARKHSTASLNAAKRLKQLSANYLELENYVTGIIEFVKLTGAKRVHLTGDSTTATGWISICVPEDKPAIALLNTLFDAQLDLGFILTVEAVSRFEPHIVLADHLSKNKQFAISEMRTNGFVDVS
jgi:hypothetical protein